MNDDIEKQLDAYIKKTIINTVIDFYRQEKRARQREISLEEIKKTNETSLSFFHGKNLEDYFENERLSEYISKLSEEKKRIIKLSILENYNSKEISKIIGKSDSRIRHILTETLKDIKKFYEQGGKNN